MNPNDFDWQDGNGLIKMHEQGKDAFHYYAQEGIPYQSCLTDKEIMQKNAKVKNFELSEQAHLANKVHTVIFLNNIFHSLLNYDLYNGSKPLMTSLLKQPFNFQEVCAAWDEQYLANKKAAEDGNKAFQGSDDFQRISSAYFKFYLASKGISTTLTNFDYSAAILEFYAEIGAMLERHKAPHFQSIQNALT